jgi:hypothetical protein
MKKVLLFGITALLIALVIISSCKKPSNGDPLANWICHCSITNNTGSFIRDIPEENQTQGSANSACAAIQVSYSSATTSAACQLQQ